VDLAYLVGEDAVHDLHEAPLAERQELLEAPFWPFDGMNEQGLAVGMAAVPAGHVPPDPAKGTIDSLGIMRLILDQAANMDDAIRLLQAYNVDMGGGPDLHYLVADRSGRSALVEFYRGEVVVLPNEGGWQVATNFLRSAVGESPAGVCHRFDAISDALAETQGRLKPPAALDLLRQAAQPTTQWSVVYGLGTGEVRIRMNLDAAGSLTFHLPLAAP
jgi:choloylglycine hydrolase